jgi:hypothetical protein
MDAATETGTGKRVRGRKDQGQEAVVKTDVLKDKVADLVHLHNKAAAAAETYGDAIKTTAEKAGLLASVVRKFVAARAGEKFEEEKKKAEQLSLVFDEVGE